MHPLMVSSDGRWKEMTKTDLMAQVALKTQLTQQQTAEVLDLFLSCIIEALEGGDKVELRGFGSFRCRHRRSRQGRNPKTGDLVEVPAKTVPFFTAGRLVQARLNPDLGPSSSLV
jgi:integration host factor subunit beta